MSGYRPIAERLKDYKPVELRLTNQELSTDLKRCQDCGIPFCHAAGCPLANVIPEINSDALHNRWNTALVKLLETNPFPEFTSRICPALCEGACVQGLNEKPVPARLVEYEVIERGFSEGRIQPLTFKRGLNLNVGVVGSGPSGLAAANTLNRAGAQVTVYEKDAKAGGFLRYGIPDFKLEKEVLDRRLELMKQEGINFECGVEVGLDISERLLKKRHQVIIMALGARKKRDLVVTGRELNGIHFATDYLSAQNRVIGGELDSLPPELNAFNRKVVVIGGGDTGSDCVGTAWRQGATEVSQFEILPTPPKSRADNNPWPQWPRVLRTSSSHEEGGLRRWNIATLEFATSPDGHGRLGSLRCREVKWIEEKGRLVRPEAIPGTEFIYPADMVFLAMGFTGPELGTLNEGQGVKPDQSGRLTPGLYICGDAATGPSLVVRAISDGLKVARTVINDLKYSRCRNRS